MSERDYPGDKVRVIPVSNSLKNYAEQRAKEILGENITYSPNMNSKDSSGNEREGK